MPKTKYFPFKGGLNLETPALSIGKGELIGCQNYECDIEGGYRRIDGYERFSGYPLASEGTYQTITFDNGEHEPQPLDRITGGTSAAYGAVVEAVVESGDWSTNDAAGYLVIYVITGTFIEGETITIYSPEAFSSGFSSAFF